MRGAITGYIDVAQIVLYAFWIFFIGLVIYLRREDKREGYPLDSDRANPRVRVQGFPAIPSPKSFRLTHGGTFQAPSGQGDAREVKATPVWGFPGSPLQPTGNPMLEGAGPGSWAERATAPELTIDGHPRIAPMRAAPEFSIESRDPDPRGMSVIGGDGAIAGVVTEVWIDRAEPQIRFLEMQVTGGSRSALVPIGFVKFDVRRRQVKVRSILARQFADVPGIASDTQITLREEDQVAAYYAGGTLYAEPARLGPLL